MKMGSFCYCSWLLSLLILLSATCDLGFCGDNLIRMTTLGGIRDSDAGSQNSAEIESLARFAVNEHNKKENALLEFGRVVKAKEQVVAGTLHHLTLEVIDAGKKKLYEAKIWVKPWLNFKELQEFKHVGDSPSLTPSNLADNRGMPAAGGIRDCDVGSQNSAEVESLARFAVDEHNKKENALLEFGRVVKAKVQVVAGNLHHLTLEVIDAGKKKLYEAKIWVKPWLNFKELQEFKHVGDSPSFTPSDLGAKRGGHEPGWREVAAHDPVVQDAANHAVKTIQQRSNSLAPYELLEILNAKAEVIEDSAKFDMLLKVKWGNKEVKFKAEVHKTLEGTFNLNQMEQLHS